MTLQDANVRVVLDVSRFERDLTRRVEQASERAGRQFERSMRSSIDRAAREGGSRLGREWRSQGTAAGREAGKGYREGFGAEATVDRGFFRAAMDRFLADADSGGRNAGKRFSRAFSGSLIGLGVAGLIPALVGGVASSATALAGLSAALAPTVGILNALPASLATVGAGAVAVRVAFAGMGDAFAAAWENDPKKFSESLKELAPNARAVATEFRALVPALREIQRSTAQAFFGPLVGQLQQLARSLRGPVQDGLRNIAGQAGQAARGIAEVVGSARGVSTLRAVFASTTSFFERLGPAARNLTSSILGFTTATIPAMDRLGRAVVTVTDRFSAYLNRQADSGRALASINTALDTFTQLGRILNQVRGILSTVFDAARASTGGFLQSLSQALARVQAFFNTARGQNALQNTFRGLNEVARATAPVFRELAQAIGRIAPVAGQLATSLSSGVARTIEAIGNATANAGPGLNRFAQGLSNALRSAAPAVESLGGSLGDLVGALTPFTGVASLAVRAIAGLAQAFTSLPEPVQAVVVALLALQRLGAFSTIGRLTREAAEAPSTFTRMAEAFRSTTASLGEFQRQQTLVNGSLSTSGAFVTAAASNFQRLGTVAAGVGSAVRVGLGRALDGLLGALGGPWGILIAGATVALTAWGRSNEEAAAKVRQHEAAVSAIQGTLDKTSGAITQVTREQASQDKAIQTAIQQFKQYNVAAQDIVEGALGQAQAQERVQNALRSGANAYLQNQLGQENLKIAMDATGLSAEQLASAIVNGGSEMDRVNSTIRNLQQNQDAFSASGVGVLNRLQRETSGLRDANTGWQEYARRTQEAQAAQRRAAEAAGLTVPQLQSLRQATDTLANSMSTTEQKANALYSAMTILNGGTIGLEQAVSTARGLVDAMGTSFATAEQQSRKLGVALIDQNGVINTNVEAGRTLLTQTDQLSRTLGTVIQQTYEKARAQGVSEAEAARLATQAGDSLVASLANQARQAGLTEAEIQGLITNYGLVPKQITTLIQTPGAAEAYLQIANLKGEVQAVPGEKKVIVESNAIQNRQELEKLGFTIKELPNKKVEITANSGPAQSALQSFLAAPARKVVDIIGRLIGGNAIGNVYGFADGGFYGGTPRPRMGRPMGAQRAEIVQPNDLRQIGDRRIGREAFLPLNRSARSKAILGISANEMDFDIVDRRARPTPAVGRSVSVAPGAIVVNAPYADPALVANAVLNEAILQAVG